MAIEANEEMSSSRAAFAKLLTVQRMLEMQRQQMRAHGGPMADQSRGRGRIIALLKLKDGIVTKDMAQILGIKVSSLNEVLSKLEKDGYVVREQFEDDKRVMIVKLTDKGREEEQSDGDLADRLFAGFDEAELESMAKSMDKLIANLGAELGEEAMEMLEEERRMREEFFANGWPGSEGCGHRGHGRGRGCCARDGRPSEDFEQHGHGHGGCGPRGHGHGGCGDSDHEDRYARQGHTCNGDCETCSNRDFCRRRVRA